MQRRRFLAALGTGAAFGTAGCLSDVEGPLGGRSGSGAGESGSGSGEPGAGGGTAEPQPTPAYRNVSLPVDEGELNRGAPKDAIPAITDPAFGADWSGVEFDLADDEQVIGVERDGSARAYPLAILNWHEIVNDEFGGPLLVTFCPLCGSGVVASRKVAGEVRTFGVSGLLWQSDLVMYDTASESLWSQILATAIRGPLTGTELTVLPATMTTWGEWRANHPDGEVLLPPPESDTITGRATRDYDRNPYATYDESGAIGIGFNSETDDRLHPKTRVVGVANGGVARAYPLDRVAEAGVVNDSVGGLPVVVTTTADGSLVAYVRRVDGETLEFERTDDVLRAGGSRWDPLSGRALDGPHEGTTLTRANDRSPMFWFAWADFYPKTEIFGGPSDYDPADGSVGEQGRRP